MYYYSGERFINVVITCAKSYCLLQSIKYVLKQYNPKPACQILYIPIAMIYFSFEVYFPSKRIK